MFFLQRRRRKAQQSRIDKPDRSANTSLRDDDIFMRLKSDWGGFKNGMLLTIKLKKLQDRHDLRRTCRCSSRRNAHGRSRAGAYEDAARLDDHERH